MERTSHQLRADETPRRGFTLIELLIVIGIIAVLASMLLPAIRSVTRASRTSATEALIHRIASAIEMYAHEQVFYPPDYIPEMTGAQPTLLLDFDGAGAISLTKPRYPAEALYYYLAHRFLTQRHPFLKLAGDETTDLDHNGTPEVSDPWGRPLLYNRRAFPGFGSTYFNYSGNPRHNTESFDLYSLGPDGQTGDTDDVPDPKAGTIANYYSKAMDEFQDGHDEDDICNWTK